VTNTKFHNICFNYIVTVFNFMFWFYAHPIIQACFPKSNEEKPSMWDLHEDVWKVFIIENNVVYLTYL
jgi:hypothetical protein